MTTEAHSFDRKLLKMDFHYPPISVWNAREGVWQSRKRLWLSVTCIKSGEGRDAALTYRIPLLMTDGRLGRKIENQTSIFDPVVAELCYQWWCPPGGLVLDPFAGGSVRGIVASMKGRRYWGCDLSDRQVAANIAQVTDANLGDHRPRWVCGDSYEQMARAPMGDFLFSCPPYGSVENYSDHPCDLSNMKYESFLERYAGIINRSCERLRDNRFAVFVVGDFRNRKTGSLHSFPSHTVEIFQRAGLHYHDECVLVTPVGSAAMRANSAFIRGHRKLVRTHQHVKVFVKGDAETAAAELWENPVDNE